MRQRIGRSTLRPTEIDEIPVRRRPTCCATSPARRGVELRDDDRELHFEIDADRRVVVQVRDLAGHVIRAIRPSEALEHLSGHTPPPPTWKVP